MTTVLPDQASTPAPTAHAVVISCDTHAAPRLREDLRQYCPARHLEAFDAYLERWERATGRMRERSAGAATGAAGGADALRTSSRRNALTDGGWDPHARLRDMDYDGVAAEVIFHGLNAGIAPPIPWTGAGGLDGSYDRELLALGRHLYNQWLADFVSVEPERRAGLAMLPMWDPAAAVAEVEWAAEAGLRGVNLPRVQPGILEYNHPDWEPFWSACEHHDMALTTHAMGAHGEPLTAHMLITVLNAVGAGARQALNYLLFGGVFDRHPRLKLVFTEQPGRWFVPTAEELDSLVVGFADFLQEPLPKRPSEYMLEHLFVGVAVLAPFEAADAVEHGYDTQVMWGSDYPHVEGSYQYPRYDGEPSLTKATLRDTFAAVPADKARLMLSENAARVYGFDLERLQGVADRIGALTCEELATPLDIDPGDPATRAQLPFYSFRRQGSYH